MVKSIVLPAHAQTTCTANFSTGGALIGNPYGTDNCADACQSAADEANGQLCLVEETGDGIEADCHCEIEIPDT